MNRFSEKFSRKYENRSSKKGHTHAIKSSNAPDFLRHLMGHFNINGLGLTLGPISDKKAHQFSPFGFSHAKLKRS
jgi:hypothetical protein